MVLMGDWRAEEGHDAVAHHLVDRALVPVDRVHHVLEDGVQDPPGLFRVALGQQLHRALEVGEEDSDDLALALERVARGEDLFGEPRRCVRVGRGESRRLPARTRRQCPTLGTESRPIR
jgi:hypothetical protein